jgi:hypothetical protein
MQAGRELELQDDQTRRAARSDIICYLVRQFNVTRSMVRRCRDEFLPELRLWSYASEGLGTIPLLPEGTSPKKWKVGEYGDDNGLRLVVKSNGEREWFFRFEWWRGGRRPDMRWGVVQSKKLGGSGLSIPKARRLSIAKARKLASEARRMLKAGRNPIDVSQRARVCGE